MTLFETKIQPQRLQRKRTKGFSLKAESLALNGLKVICVDRTSWYWGNPFVVGRDGTVEECLEGYKEYLAICRSETPELFAAQLANLKGKNLACFCATDKPCHADILLERANPKTAD